MKKIILIAIALLFSFFLGYSFERMNADETTQSVQTGRVTSLGGIFFKCKEPAKLKDWYRQNLGMKIDQYGTCFEWRHGADSSLKGYTQWSPFNEKTKYFEPSAKEFMINYRVDNMDAMIETFKKNGVTITDSVQSYSYGKFLHIMDLEGNKIELWEPNDIEYGKIDGVTTK